MKILLVEDEAKTAGYLRKGLTEEGFIVDTAPDGDRGLHLAKDAGFDLIVLDVMLPGRNGWEVLMELRRSGQQTPVLMLTARDAN
jgi:two-component system copper resistance phosphate regulon response regulator CusR